MNDKQTSGKLTDGLTGLCRSRKGTLCMLLMFSCLIPMTVLCYLGRIEGYAYGYCMTALTTAAVAVFCHTQSQTDQAAINCPPAAGILGTVISEAREHL